MLYRRKRACAFDQPRGAPGRPRGQCCHALCHAPRVTASATRVTVSPIRGSQWGPASAWPHKGVMTPSDKGEDKGSPFVPRWRARNCGRSCAPTFPALLFDVLWIVTNIQSFTRVLLPRLRRARNCGRSCAPRAGRAPQAGGQGRRSPKNRREARTGEGTRRRGVE